MNKVQANNERMLELLSTFLNEQATNITINQVNKLVKLGIGEERAVQVLLAGYLGISDMDVLGKDYLPYLVKKLDACDYTINPYYRNIDFKKLKKHKWQNWELKTDCYKPYELFVCDDFQYLTDGRIIPQLGYFDRPFYFPAVYEQNRLWMSVTPNEIATMQDAINTSSKVVGTIGLGLGYFAYMVALKPVVEQVIIVEKDANVIQLFCETILPLFPNPSKITIIQLDAFVFLEEELAKYPIKDLFIDIWHDAGDGQEYYLRMKPYEKRYPHVNFKYWIEKTLKTYTGEI